MFKYVGYNNINPELTFTLKQEVDNGISIFRCMYYYKCKFVAIHCI